MIDVHLEMLQCSYCGGALTVDSVDSSSKIDASVLKCQRCNVEFPVVAGIAVLMHPDLRLDSKAQTTDSIVATGPRIGDIVNRIRKGDSRRVLAELISAPPEGCPWRPRWVRRLPVKPVRIALDRLFWQSFISRRTRDAIKGTGFHSDQTAMEALKRWYGDTELYNYFAFRFGQPRHLAALAVASLVASNDRHVLDLACGMGHLTHFLSARSKSVIGLDRSFLELYIAKTFVEPNATYVCAEADQPLPFVDQAFDASFCSDAFHYFLNRQGAARELMRTTGEGTIGLTRFGNVMLEPREGYELAPVGYAELFKGRATTMLSEEQLLDRYLNRNGPLDGTLASTAYEDAKWLSMIVLPVENGDVVSAESSRWPHSEGRLVFNPLYDMTSADDDFVVCQFSFPSTWYEYENAEWIRYAPRQVRVHRDVVASVAANDRTPEVEALISKCVVLGVPENYI